MAKNKNYLIVKFQTEEDFKKHFDSIYQSGYGSGYQDGMIACLTYVFDLLEHFSPSVQENAAYLAKERSKQLMKKRAETGNIPIIEDPAYREQKEKLKSILESNKFLEEVKRLKEEKNKES